MPTILLLPAAAMLGAILLHALACRLTLPFGSVLRFLAVGLLCGLSLILALVGRFGLSAEVIGAVLAFAFAAELYVFLFTLSLTSISANVLVLLARRAMKRSEIDETYPDHAMAALRVERLLAAGLAHELQGNLCLSRKGRLVARLFGQLRRFFARAPIE